MWSLLLPSLAIIGGTLLSSQANTKAANTAVAGIQQGVSEQQGEDAAIAAQGGAGPGTSYLRTLMASPNTLNPAQQSQLKNLRQATANELHGSDFAGSGRSAAALFKNTEDNFTNTALQGNQVNAIGAANKLSSQSTSAAEAGANAGANAATEEANIEANSGLATGKVYGQALGDIGSLIAKDSKLNSLS